MHQIIDWGFVICNLEILFLMALWPKRDFYCCITRTTEFAIIWNERKGNCIQARKPTVVIIANNR